MFIESKKVLYKNPKDALGNYGKINIEGYCDKRKVFFKACILGTIEEIKNFEAENVRKGMEVLFNEKCRENNNSDGEGVFRA